MTTRHRFRVPDSLDGVRLDRSLPHLNDEWTRSRARKLIDGGFVRINRQPAKASTIVRGSDVVEVDEPPPENLEVAAEEIDLSVIFEDEHIVVIDKPAGLVIHPAAGNPSGTLVNALLHHCKDLSGIGGVARPGIVHRLDKDTSGVMVVAKTDRAHQHLALAFRRRQISKTYLGACYGVPRDPDGVVEAAIDRHPQQRQKMAVVADGRPARTLYHVEHEYAGTALISCRPITGRTHQIRVHMAHVGHALIGDPLYAGRQWRNLNDPQVQMACRVFPRQALHAWKLQFAHPATGKIDEFVAPVPQDIDKLLAVLASSGLETRRPPVL